MTTLSCQSRVQVGTSPTSTRNRILLSIPCHLGCDWLFLVSLIREIWPTASRSPTGTTHFTCISAKMRSRTPGKVIIGHGSISVYILVLHLHLLLRQNQMKKINPMKMTMISNKNLWNMMKHLHLSSEIWIIRVRYTRPDWNLCSELFQRLRRGGDGYLIMCNTGKVRRDTRLVGSISFLFKRTQKIRVKLPKLLTSRFRIHSAFKKAWNKIIDFWKSMSSARLFISIRRFYVWV